MDMTNVDKAVASMIERAVNGVDAAVAFGAAQLPDIIRQLLVWKTTQYTFLALLFAVVLAVCVAVSVHAARRYRNPDLLLMFSIAAIVSGAILVLRICYLLQIVLAPKVWLLEYARDLLK